MKSSESLTYTNTATKQSVNISFNADLIPIGFSEDADTNFYTDKNNGQDGQTMQNLDLEPRVINIQAVFQTVGNYRLFEKRIKSVFNPKTLGELKLADGEYIKTITCYPQSIPSITIPVEKEW